MVRKESKLSMNFLPIKQKIAIYGQNLIGHIISKIQLEKTY